MAAEGENYTPAEIGRALKRIEDAQGTLTTKVDNLGGHFVSRGEFDAWRIGLDREIKAVREAQTRPPVWPAIVASVAGLVSIAVAVIAVATRSL